MLIADDSRVAREVLHRMFYKHAYLTISWEASNGFEVVEFAHRFLPDLVITDFQMPHQNGITSSRKIFALLPLVPIILSTFHAESLHERDTHDSGIRRVVSKCELHTLVDLAEELTAA